MERIGRTQRTPVSSQRIDLGQETAASASGNNVGEHVIGGAAPLAA